MDGLLILLLWLGCCSLIQCLSVDTRKKRVIVVGGGLSGLVVGYVLQQSERYDVTLLEASPRIGGNVLTVPDPADPNQLLNVGHATHLGMFWNLRLLLRHLQVPEYAVGRGVASKKPGLFGMLSITDQEGRLYRPPLEDILSPLTWWHAFWFYFLSYQQPDVTLEDFLKKHTFSDAFLNILYWSMATFEFDKEWKECCQYPVGVVRVLTVTQVFFQFLLSDLFQGVLPAKMQQGLRDDLADRVVKSARSVSYERDTLMRDDLGRAPLASYFTANYTLACDRLAAGAGQVRTNCNVARVRRRDSTSNDGMVSVEMVQGDSIVADSIVLTIQPSAMKNIISPTDFPEHVQALRQMESGAVGVRIVRAEDLPFQYPPYSELDCSEPNYQRKEPPVVLGTFDISELTFCKNKPQQKNQVCVEEKAGYLSVAYPVYREEARNRHQKWLEKIPSVDCTVYPWVRATPSFGKARQQLVELQGKHDGVYITGHTLTGVNKASELQVTNALKLCHDHFSVEPPWGDFFPVPLLPDCNDEDAFQKIDSPFEAIRLAFKNLLGSFWLVAAAVKLGVEKLD
jgi:hypothetical protein